MSFRGPRSFPVAVLAAFGLLCALAGPAFAEPQDGARPNDLEREWTLRETETTRAPSTLLEAPLAISALAAPELFRARPATALDEGLDLIPGVFPQGGRNFAQDSRVSIRGYGARAAFGVRGVRMEVDGIPLTLPDGQSEVDSLDLAFVERVEVIRSQVSSLHGGGAGGLIRFDTYRPTAETRLLARALWGKDSLRRYTGIATGTAGRTGWVAGLAHTRTAGYRDHARARHSSVLGKLERDLGARTRATLHFTSTWAPVAQDPGGLDAARVATDRKSARPAARTRDTGERLDQQRLALTLEHALAPGRTLEAKLWWLDRDFRNALPINRRVDLDRRAGGASLVWNARLGYRTRVTAGVDAAAQRDERFNFQNLAGARGALTLRQSEQVRTVGPFAQIAADLPGDFGLVAGLRYDWSEFVIGDRFVGASNGDRSDRMRFRHASPHLALHWGRDRRVRARVALVSAWRVPTTTELAPADSLGGFASDIDPESTLGLEIGVKGLIGDRLAYDVALFDLRLRHVAVAFDDGMGVTRFRDAGRVRRRGLEIATALLLRPGLQIRTAYTYADYRYTDYDVVSGGVTSDLDGHHEPNLPRHHFSGELRWDHSSGLFGVLALRHSSDLETNDANTAESRGATLSDVRVGFERDMGETTWVPFVGVRNWTGARYDQTLRPNAFGGRFFEPAPLAELYGGIEVRFGAH